MDKLVVPPGNPTAIEDEAAAIARYAVQAGNLAAATHRATTGVVADGEWTGKAADAYSAWTQGLVRGLGNTEEPLARVPHAVGGYAAALRAAQTRVTAYNNSVDAAGLPGTATSPAARHMLAQLRADAEHALAALEDAANESGRLLAGIGEELNHVFDASGPFSKWLDTIMRPWEATAADVLLELLQSKGEKSLKDFEAAADWKNGGLSKALARTMNELLKDPLTEAASRADLADAAASGDLQELDAVLQRWQNLRGAAQAFSDQWYDQPLSLLGKLLPGMKVLGGLTSAAGGIGGVYTAISPPSYDGGNQQAFDRAAGAASAFGGGTGLAVAAGVDFSELTALGIGLTAVPVAGEVLGVGAGLYLAGDWAYHHTHQIAHTFDTARHACAHYADNVGHAVFVRAQRPDRRRAVNKVESLAAAAERDGTVPLPLLTQADLCVLNAASQSLICERTWTWWTGLADSQRADLTARSLEVLALRGLVAPVTDGKIPAAPAPELGLILAARTRPQVIVTCQVPGRDAAFEPRFFGVTEERGGLRALVRETLTSDAPGTGGRADFGTILRYTLMTPSSAADAMTAWTRARGAATTIDVFGHGADGHLSVDRFEIRPAGNQYDVRCPAGGIPPGRLDHMELLQALASALTGAAR